MYVTLSFIISLKNLPDFVLIKELGIINPTLFEDFNDFSKNAQYKSILPSVTDFKSFFNTKSADGIINPRFYELLALGIPIICPYDDYYGLLTDGYNCKMYHEPSEINDIINCLITDKVSYNNLRKNAINSVKDYYISVIVRDILKDVKQLDRDNK